MKDSEMGVMGDETYNEVFKDYTQMAHSHPERLVRPNQRNSVVSQQESSDEWLLQYLIFKKQVDDFS